MAMSIDEAIQHCEEMALCNKNGECGEEHRQLAEWLSELKRLRAEPVRTELRKAVDLLHKNYEKALDSSYVRNPIAWALYHTWREVNENNSGNAIN